MASKYRSHARFSVRTPEALAALGRWIEETGERAQARGREYHAARRVYAAWAGADHYVEAEVHGQERYTVTLFLTRGKWTSTCTCPASPDCKHTVAAALAWIESQGSDFDHHPPANQVTPLTLAPDPEPARPAPATRVRPHEIRASFREQWTPVLVEKLGRPLTAEEIRMLGQLSGVFHEFTQSFFRLHPLTLSQHGFGDAVAPGTPPWQDLYPGCWTPATAPADPWALWQYIAHALEANGKPVPEAFRPLTDTEAVRVRLESAMIKQQLQQWRTALNPPATAPAAGQGPAVLDGVAGIRARITSEGGLIIETRAAPDKPWRTPHPRWAAALGQAVPADLETLPPGEAALAATLAMANRHNFLGGWKRGVPPEMATAILASRVAREAVVLPDGTPFRIEAEPLAPEATLAGNSSDRLAVRLVAPDGSDAADAVVLTTGPGTLYLHRGRVWRGPAPLPKVPLPVAALGDVQLMTQLRAVGLKLPRSIEVKRRVVVLQPVLKMWLADANDVYMPQQFCAQLIARSNEPRCEQQWCGVGGWQWSKGGAPPPRRPEDPLLEFDLTAAQAVSARFVDFRLRWNDWTQAWTRAVTNTFPDEVLAWRATLPEPLEVEAAAEIAAFFGPPLRAHMDFSARPADAAHDWFDLTVALRVEDKTLTAEEVALLLKARGKWVRLPQHGWRRLEFEGLQPGDPTAAALDRLGLTAEDVLASGRTATHRIHALQLASEAATLEARDAKLAAGLRERVATLAAVPVPELPAGLTATLRPYQKDGYHFLAHLAAHGFGGVLADDMGLGKTVQALAWLLHLAAPSRTKKSKFRALVVCPKSVMHGWFTETARFAPGLTTTLFTTDLLPKKPAALAESLVIANYTQLRLNADWFRSGAWDAVILDEGQFIKNPTSQVATTARALPSRHRLVLTGTPIENRLTDLWSLFAFAQPGLLGPQSAFRRQYDEKDPAALGRLHRRVRHFLLRRTKAEAAPDLPPRTEDDLAVDLEPAQRKLYDAELKRARLQLLGIETDQALDKVRFNILASLLRLRQICCHPALVDPAHASLPSAKLEALLERVEELKEEGHQVLVFSQFVEMLGLIRTRLDASGIGNLMLTGATENRAQLVDQFQSDPTKTVFLLSLKAAGFGLNLTAASYAILYDPWWNPAVEAQAIDRTHRIGQTKPVIAYRLLASETIEQKIRLLQQEKAALAAAVVQEESLARVLDLQSLRRILA